MNHNRLVRNTQNKMIGGVAAGLADYFQTDVSIIRVLFVLAMFVPFTFPVVFFYIILWMIMPAVRNTSAPVNEGHYPL